MRPEHDPAAGVADGTTGVRPTQGTPEPGPPDQDTPEQGRSEQDRSVLPADDTEPYRPRGAVDPDDYEYVEDFVRAQLSSTLGGPRGMIESALPFVGFTVAWLLARDLYVALGAALGVALILAVIRLIQRQSIRYVVQAIVPTAIAAIVASRTGRAQDVFLPGILYNGGLALLSIITIAVRRPLVGFIVGAAMGDPTGWAKDRGLVKMTAKLTAVLAVPYVARFVIQLPLFLGGQVVALGVAKVVLGWPLLIAALAVIGLLLSRGRTPMEGSVLSRSRTLGS